MPGLLEQPHDALAQQHRVLGDDYSHGITARTVVPRPAALVDLEPAVERRDPVGEAAQAGAARRVGAADAVVADLDRRPAPFVALDPDLGARGLGVAGDVGERLGDDEVGGRLDRRGQPLAGALRRARPAPARGRRAHRAPRRARGR